jgi:uncharacterized protein YndB with AHSA1/START domain
MATESIRVSGIVAASPGRVYEAWLSGREHGAMTGGKATSDATIGGAFTAWDGYIWGRNHELDPGQRIVQSWRTSDFPKDAADSRLEVLFEPAPGGTRITFVHSEIPESQGTKYRDGWLSFYLQPMARYFEQAGRPTQILDASSMPGVTPKPLAKAKPKSVSPKKKAAPKKKKAAVAKKRPKKPAKKGYIATTKKKKKPTRRKKR